MSTFRSTSSTARRPIRTAIALASLVLGLVLLASCSSDGQQYDRQPDDTVAPTTSEAPVVTATTVPDPHGGTSDTTEVAPEDGSDQGTLPPNGSTEKQGGDGSTGYTEGGADTQDDSHSVGG